MKVFERSGDLPQFWSIDVDSDVLIVGISSAAVDWNRPGLGWRTLGEIDAYDLRGIWSPDTIFWVEEIGRSTGSEAEKCQWELK